MLLIGGLKEGFIIKSSEVVMSTDDIVYKLLFALMSSALQQVLCVCQGELPIHNGSLDFIPTLQLPGLQYVEHVDARSSASEAGLRPGDFILEVWLITLSGLLHSSDFKFSSIQN